LRNCMSKNLYFGGNCDPGYKKIGKAARFIGDVQKVHLVKFFDAGLTGDCP